MILIRVKTSGKCFFHVRDENSRELQYILQNDEVQEFKLSWEKVYVG